MSAPPTQKNCSSSNACLLIELNNIFILCLNCACDFKFDPPVVKPFSWLSKKNLYAMH